MYIYLFFFVRKFYLLEFVGRDETKFFLSSKYNFILWCFYLAQKVVLYKNGVCYYNLSVPIVYFIIKNFRKSNLIRHFVL